MSTVGRSFIKLGPVMSVPFRHLPLKGAAESKTTQSFFLVRLYLKLIGKGNKIRYVHLRLRLLPDWHTPCPGTVEWLDDNLLGSQVPF